jgi:hypothetical protein
MLLLFVRWLHGTPSPDTSSYGLPPNERKLRSPGREQPGALSLNCCAESCGRPGSRVKGFFGRSPLSLPPLRVSIPNTVGEQPIQIGKIGIAVDEEVQAFAIFFARPLASPHLPSRIIAVEVRTPER